MQLETSNAVLIAAGVARPGAAIGGGGDEGVPPIESLPGLPLELLLGGRGDGVDCESGALRKWCTSVRMVKCWAAVAMIFRVRKKRYCVKIGASLNADVEEDERSMRAQVR